MAKRILFTKINTAEFTDFIPKELPDNFVRVKTMFSTISAGTEKANITGDPNVSLYTPENPEVRFPREVGYSSSGIVIQVGKSVTSLKEGDRVAMFSTFHRSINDIPENNAILIPEKMSLSEAALCYIGNFPLNAVRKTNVEIGESALVMGLGILGLYSVQFLKAAGAVPVIAVDPKADRREKALKFGADYALDPFVPDFADTVKKLTDGGANVAIEVTGLGSGLDMCLDCMAKFGRVALLGCTRDRTTSIDYYRKVHGNGVSLIGAHTVARAEQESSHGNLTNRDELKAILKLCISGRIKLEEMIDEIHSPKDCFNVYDRLVNDKDFPVVVQFDWSDVDD